MYGWGTMEKSTFNALKRRLRLSEDEKVRLIRASILPFNERNILEAFVTAANEEESRVEDETFWRLKLGPGPWFSRFRMDYWPSMDAVCFVAQVSLRTARTHIHRLVALGILVRKHPANSRVPGFGNLRPVTYTLNLRALKARKV